MRQAAREVPRWRQGRQAAPQIRLSPVQEKRLVRQVTAQAGMPGTGVPHPVPGSVPVARAFRWRRHLIPFAWLALGSLAALGCRRAHAVPLSVLLGAGPGAVMVALSRHLKPFARKATAAAAFLTALWLPPLAAFGPKPCAGLALICWAGVTVAWIRHYRWRPEDEPAVPDLTDYDTWNLLAAERKWNAHLGPVQALPGGGRRYPVQCDGIRTTVSNVLAASENVAGAWHKPMTEAYAERDPVGVTSLGYLTILGSDTLMRVREWNGAGIDPATGMAMAGRYADGSPAHLKFITPRFGTRHGLVSGTTGSGKTELLNLIVWLAVTSPIPFVPVVLDPQEGQSLPFWRDRVIYAAGVHDCLVTLAGLRAGMLGRSRYLSSLRWDDDGIAMRGMPNFDQALTGLPVPLIIFDEAHMLLADNGKAGQAALEAAEGIGRLGRKTGTALWLATHIPSLSDLGGSQALRDMLRGGNVVSMRTANRVAGGMLGLEKDPSEIPSFFRDGKETYGLGYVAGPDNRPDAPMRTDLVPTAMRRKVPVVPALDDRFAEAMDRAMEKLRTASVPAPASLGPIPLAAVPDDDGPPGHTAADAILEVMRGRGETPRGDIIAVVRELATGKWGREKPFAIRTIGLALEKLLADGRLIQPAGREGKGIYLLPSPPSPALTRVK